MLSTWMVAQAGLEVYYFLPSSFLISHIPNPSQMRKAEFKVISGKRARDREESTFPSLTDLSEINIAVNLAFAVVISACCCNQNVPWINRLLKAYWIGTRFWQKTTHFPLLPTARFVYFKKVYSTLKFFLHIHLKIFSRKYNRKKSRVLKHLERPARHTCSMLLLPYYSYFLRSFSLLKGRTKETLLSTENCRLWIFIIDSKLLRTDITLLESWYATISISLSQVLPRQQLIKGKLISQRIHRLHHTWLFGLHPMFSQ